MSSNMHLADEHTSTRRSFSSGTFTPSHSMPDQKEVLIISDESTCDAICEVRDLLKSSKKSPILGAFFYKLIDAINSELPRLDPSGRCRISRFTDLEEVVRNAAQDTSIDNTLDAIVLYSIRIGNLLL